MRGEPVFIFAAIEKDLQAAQPQRNQPDADIVDLQPPFRPLALPGRIFQQLVDRQHRQDADRDIDKEDPAPAVVIGDPAAQRRSDNGRDNNGDRREAERLTAIFRLKVVEQHRLLHRLQAAAKKALQHAEQDDLP